MPIIQILQIDADNPHPNGDRASSRYGRVEMVTRQRDAEQTLHDRCCGTGTAYDTVVWGPIALNAGSSFQGRIRNVRITDQTGVYPWLVSLSVAPAARPIGFEPDADRLHDDIDSTTEGSDALRAASGCESDRSRCYLRDI